MVSWLKTSLLILQAMTAWGACDWPWSLNHPDDPFRCVPQCTGGEVCIEGRCVLQDASTLDLPTADAPPDRAAPDAKTPTKCGNTKLETHEACDGILFGGKTCKSLGYKNGGDLACTKQCKLDLRGCLWATSFGGATWDTGYGIEVDSAGNSYSTGDYTGKAQFGKYGHTAKGWYEIFVTKMDPSGEVLWATSIGDIGHDSGQDIAIDSSGNSYITGYFENTVSFGSKSLTSTGGQDIYLSKLDPTGKVLWGISAGSSEDDQGYGVAASSNGFVYFTGSFKGTITLGSTPLFSKGNTDSFYAKVDGATGKVLWAYSVGSKDDERGRGVAVDGSGNAYFTGGFRNTVKFGTHEHNAGAALDLYVIKVNPAGVVQWATTSGGTNADWGNDLVLDGTGNIYLTGSFYLTAKFGTTTLTGKGKAEIFAAKLDPKGDYLWAVGGGGTENDEGTDIAVDSAGNSYFTGNFNTSATLAGKPITAVGKEDVFVAKVSPAGEVLWVSTVGGKEVDRGNGIAVDGSGNLYSTGSFQAAINLGSVALQAAGENDIYIWKPGKTWP